MEPCRVPSYTSQNRLIKREYKLIGCIRSTGTCMRLFMYICKAFKQSTTNRHRLQGLDGPKNPLQYCVPYYTLRHLYSIAFPLPNTYSTRSVG